MATSPYTTDNLIKHIRLLPTMPSVQALLSDEDLLTLMNMELTSKIVPLIDNQAEEYFVAYKDIPYDGSTRFYDVPERTVAEKLRGVNFVDASGNEIVVPRLRPEDTNSNVNATGIAIMPAVWGFFFKDDQIVLYLNTIEGTSGFPTLRFKFLRRPSTMVVKSQAALIANVNYGTNQIVVSNLPTTFTTDEIYDIIKGRPSFTSRGDDLAVTTVAGNTITFTDPLPTGIVKGDWVALAGQTPIPQIPFDAFPLLEQLSAAKALEVHGDLQGFNVAMSQAASMKDYFISMITPRNDASVIKLTSPNSIFNWD